jgi:hypothetical protein
MYYMYWRGDAASLLFWQRPAAGPRWVQRWQTLLGTQGWVCLPQGLILVQQLRPRRGEAECWVQPALSQHAMPRTGLDFGTVTAAMRWRGRIGMPPAHSLLVTQRVWPELSAAAAVGQKVLACPPRPFRS